APLPSPPARQRKDSGPAPRRRAKPAPPQRPTNTGPPITGVWTPCCADTGPPPTSSTSPARQPTGREEPNRNSRTNEAKEPWGPGPKVGNPRVNYSSAAAHRACQDGPDPPANCLQARQHEHRHRTPVRFGRRTTAAAALAPHT